MVNIMVRWCFISIISLLPCMHQSENVANKSMHPFYVSMIEINHNVKEKTVEVSVRIFTEDLENTLKKYGNTQIDILHPANKATVDKLLNDYIQHKLQLNLNDKSATLQYVGYEQQMESIWTYLEVKDVASIKKVSVNCSLLYNYQDKQTNIFHIKANGKEKSYKLDYPETNFTVNSEQ